MFAIGSLIALTVTWWLVQRLGLPDWVFVAAIGLLVAGLPIVFRAGKARTPAGAGQQHRACTGRAGWCATENMSTLRGAMGGGILAFAGLVVGAAAFMGTPGGRCRTIRHLVSAGVLSSKDKLVLADFGEPDQRLDAGPIGHRGAADRPRAVDDGAFDRAAGYRGGAPPDAARRVQRHSTQDVAQEVAAREGAKALIAGEIAPLGVGFVLSARVVSADDGRTLLAERESAADASQLIAAVDKLSRKVREGIGESLKSIRVGEPLEEVSTASLEALRKFSLAERMADQSRYAEAKVLLQDAVALDSNFRDGLAENLVSCSATRGRTQR
jgi:hypothetical protein